MSLLKLAVLAAAVPTASMLFATPPAHPASTDSHALQLISAEPTSDQVAGTIRWSPDSAAAAWMRLNRPAPNPRNNNKRAPTQQEIWEIESHPGSSTASPAEPKILLQADKVQEIVKQSGPIMHERLDQSDDVNPYLLQDFLWSNDHASLLLIGLHSLTWVEVATGRPITLWSGKETLSDVSLSPDGKSVIFLEDHKMVSLSASAKPDGSTKSTAHPQPILASPTREGILDGEPDWPYRNELKMPRAYWWSPDSTQIAYFETDDRKVASYTMRASDGSTRDIVYPKPGGDLPVVHVFVKHLTGGAPIEMQFGNTANVYIPLVQWLPDGHHLAIERLDRRQQTLELLLSDTKTGKTTTILTERDKYWINLSKDLYFLKDSQRFLWSSERTGFRHIYLYDIAGKQQAQLTHGEWEVEHVDAIDEAKGLIYLTTDERSPLERQVASVKLTAGPTAGSGSDAPTPLTAQPGTHTPFFAPDAAAYVDVFSTQSTRPKPELIHVSETEASTTQAAGSSSGTEPKDQPVEFMEVTLHTGISVHAFMIKPPAFDPTRKYPVIVYMAGGPGEQLVRDAWAGPTGMWMQLMAKNGYILFGLDNQGTGGRGHYFEEPIHLRFGGLELADQRDGLQYLSTLPYVDTDRLGVCGWGYGGFLAVHAMLDRPLPFKAGFAGAAVTDWRYYDAVFGERYLDDPIAHADGWDASIALENAQFLKGKILLAQGTDDEFVHIENLLTLQDEFVDAGKTADILLLPDRGHQIDDPSGKLVLFTRMTDFFSKNL